MGFAKPPRQVEFCEACFVDWQLRGHHDKMGSGIECWALESNAGLCKPKKMMVS